MKSATKTHKQRDIDSIANAMKTAETLGAIVPAIPPAIVAVEEGQMPYPPFEKMTNLVVHSLRTAFSYGCTVIEACAHAGISKTTYYDFIAAYPDMADTFEGLRMKPFLGARQSVVASFPVRPDIAIRFLEDTLPEFNQKKTVKVEGEMTINFSVELAERSKKYEQRPIDTVATEVPPPDVGGVES